MSSLIILEETLLLLNTILLNNFVVNYTSGPPEPVVPWYPQILADQLILSQPGLTNYDHFTTTALSGFSDLPTTLYILT